MVHKGALKDDLPQGKPSVQDCLCILVASGPSSKNAIWDELACRPLLQHLEPLLHAAMPRKGKQKVVK